jgi:hypothetical protein
MLKLKKWPLRKRCFITGSSRAHVVPSLSSSFHILLSIRPSTFSCFSLASAFPP